MGKERYRVVSLEILFFVSIIIFVCSIALGYFWRYHQVPSVEKAIVKALNGCSQLQTEELVVMPTVDCNRFKTAIIAPRGATFNYYQTRGDK